MQVSEKWLLENGFVNSAVYYGNENEHEVPVLALWGPDGCSDIMWFDDTLCIYHPGACTVPAPLIYRGYIWTTDEVVLLCRLLGFPMEKASA